MCFLATFLACWLSANRWWQPGLETVMASLFCPLPFCHPPWERTSLEPFMSVWDPWSSSQSSLELRLHPHWVELRSPRPAPRCRIVQESSSACCWTLFACGVFVVPVLQTLINRTSSPSLFLLLRATQPVGLAMKQHFLVELALGSPDRLQVLSVLSCLTGASGPNAWENQPKRRACCFQGFRIILSHEF